VGQSYLKTSYYLASLHSLEPQTTHLVLRLDMVLINAGESRVSCLSSMKLTHHQYLTSHARRCKRYSNFYCMHSIMTAT